MILVEEDDLPERNILENLVDYRQAINPRADGSVEAFFFQAPAEIVHVSFPGKFDAFAWPILLVILVVSTSMLTGTVYLWW